MNWYNLLNLLFSSTVAIFNCNVTHGCHSNLKVTSEKWAESHNHAQIALRCYLAPNGKLTAVTSCMQHCLKLKANGVLHYKGQHTSCTWRWTGVVQIGFTDTLNLLHTHTLTAYFKVSLTHPPTHTHTHPHTPTHTHPHTQLQLQAVDCLHILCICTVEGKQRLYSVSQFWVQRSMHGKFRCIYRNYTCICVPVQQPESTHCVGKYSMLKHLRMHIYMCEFASACVQYAPARHSIKGVVLFETLLLLTFSVASLYTCWGGRIVPVEQSQIHTGLIT